MSLKRCPRCELELPLDSFNKARSRLDGRQAYCRVCQLAVNREAITRKPDTRRQTLRRQYRRSGRRSTKDSTVEKRLAHKAVEAAIRCGRLVRPAACPACGAGDSPVQAHHDDYAKPLEIRWLCARCHGREHALEPTDWSPA